MIKMLTSEKDVPCYQVLLTLVGHVLWDGFPQSTWEGSGKFIDE